MLFPLIVQQISVNITHSKYNITQIGQQFLINPIVFRKHSTTYLW